MANSLRERVLTWADSRRDRLIVQTVLGGFLSAHRKPALIQEAELQQLLKQKRIARSERQIPESTQREEMVSICIYAYERLELLEKTYASLHRYLQEYGQTFSYELLFIHDGPNAQISAWAKDKPFTKVIFNEENRGLTHNMNELIFVHSRGKYILNIEDDWICEFKDNFIRGAIDILESNDSVGCVRLERKYPGDYKKWNEAFKIHQRRISKEVFETPGAHPYRLLDANPENGEGIYANSCTLFSFEALQCAGFLPDEGVQRRDQERIYMKTFNSLWMAARGEAQADSPFLHIGYGKSCPTWDTA
ncbi:glycosyltransferase [Patescibacteria group bacterium]|nr:glycosyltransferase [Patescibacteria group bacterium]